MEKNGVKMNWARTVFGRIIKDEYLQCRKVNEILRKSKETHCTQ